MAGRRRNARAEAPHTAIGRRKSRRGVRRSDHNGGGTPRSLHVEQPCSDARRRRLRRPHSGRIGQKIHNQPPYSRLGQGMRRRLRPQSRLRTHSLAASRHSAAVRCRGREHGYHGQAAGVGHTLSIYRRLCRTDPAGQGGVARGGIRDRRMQRACDAGVRYDRGTIYRPARLDSASCPETAERDAEHALSGRMVHAFGRQLHGKAY